MVAGGWGAAGMDGNDQTSKTSHTHVHFTHYTLEHSHQNSEYYYNNTCIFIVLNNGINLWLFCLSSYLQKKQN